MDSLKPPAGSRAGQPPRGFVPFGASRSESWLHLHCFAWLILTSVFGFHEIIKGHCWPGFLQLRPKLTRMKPRAWQELRAWRPPPASCRLATRLCTFWKTGVEAVLPPDDAQPETRGYAAHSAPVSTGCMWSWTNRVSESLCEAKGSLKQGRIYARVKNWASRREPFKSKTQCPHPNVGPLLFYIAEHEVQPDGCSTWSPKKVSITGSPYKLTANRIIRGLACVCYLISYLLQRLWKAVWEAMVLYDLSVRINFSLRDSKDFKG